MKNPRDSFESVIELIKTFRDERQWAQFHDSKNLALAISIEAAELNELFLWKSGKEIENMDIPKLSEELADIFTFSILLAEKHNLNIPEIIRDKISKNAIKYPIEKSKGSAKKYTDL